MNNKIKAALLTILTFGLVFGLLYGITHYAHIIGMLFVTFVFTFGVYLLYSMYKGMLDYKDKNKHNVGSDVE